MNRVLKYKYSFKINYYEIIKNNPKEAKETNSRNGGQSTDGTIARWAFKHNHISKYGNYKWSNHSS